jgi:oxygen-independent coproporphyrinogen-3 oxidase
LKAVEGKFDCVDVDLIFDIAFDDKSVFLHDLELCLQAGVEQISTYPLMRFGYTPFGKSKHEPEKEHQVLGEATALAQHYGYERRSVWTFNRQDAPNYTSVTREFYLGCGAGAGTYSGEIFYLNHFSIPAYIEKVKNGNLPVARITQLSQRKSATYYLFWQAYTGKINLAHFDELFPGQLMLKSLLATFSWFGILQRHGQNMVLTPRGYDHYHDLERWVTYRFIEPLWNDMMHEHEFLMDHLSPLTLIQRMCLYLEGMQRR